MKSLVVILLVFSGPLYAQVPTILNVDPKAGQIGTQVTITGTNFSTTPSQNIVRFGAVTGSVTGASATSLTVTVPAGATFRPLSVTTSGFTAYSMQPFVVTFPSDGQIGSGSFGSATGFGVSGGQNSVAIGDVDGDGKPDLVAANVNTATVSVLRNTSSGSISFASKVDFTVAGDSSLGVALGDLDGDGRLDIVATNAYGNSVSVLRNTSSPGSINTGSFASHAEFGTGGGPRSVQISDLDGDGKPDIVTTIIDNNSVAILHNTSTVGSISFDAVDLRGAGSSPRGIVIADFDGDARPDLAAGNFNNGTVTFLRNISSPGSILFDLEQSVNAGTQPLGTAVGDIDGDGKPELLIANFGSTSITVYHNTSSVGTISFANGVDFAAPTQPRQIAVADLDGDGKLDLAVSDRGADSVSVYHNVGSGSGISTGTFAPRVNFKTGTEPRYVAVGDLNADGKPELVTADNGTGMLSVFENTVSPPPVGTFVADPMSLSFSLVEEGMSDSDTVTVENQGGLPLSISSITTPTAFSVSPPNATIGAGNSQDFVITFSPPSPGYYAGDLLFNHDGASSPGVVTVEGPAGKVDWSTQNSGTVAVLQSTKAVTPRISWTAGPVSVLRTTDAGLSWVDAGSGPGLGARDLATIDAIDGNTAFLAGSVQGTGQANIYRTTNGGSSWTGVYTVNGSSMNGIHMFDALTGIAVGDPEGGTWVIVRTTDGGGTWNRIASEPAQISGDVGVLNAVASSGSFVAFAGLNGTMYRSSDSGVSWTSVAAPVDTVLSLWFTTPTTGIAAGKGPGSSYKAARTTNGGTSWTPLTIPDSSSYGVLAGAGLNDYWIGIGHVVYRTTDLGSTWAPAYANTHTLRAGSFAFTADTSTGWFVGTSGSIGRFSGFLSDVLAAPSATTNGATSIDSTSAMLHGTVNPNNAVATVVFQYGTTTGYGDSIVAAEGALAGASPQATSASLTGLTPNTLYHYRVVARNAYGTSTGNDQIFTTSLGAPSAQTGNATSVNGSGAVIHGMVNPGGSSTTVRFDYGTTTAYGNQQTATESPVTGTSPVSVSAQLAGLTPSTVYHYQVVASNGTGTSSGGDQFFITAAGTPIATSGAATSLSPSGATLNAMVDPQGSSTTVVFEYGLTTGYGNQVAAAQSPVTGTGAVAVSAVVSGLTANTLYHFRVAASNLGGSINSSDTTFTTPAVGAPPVPGLSAPANGSGNQTLPVTFSWAASAGATGYHLQVATDGSFTHLVVNDSTLSTTSKLESALAFNTTYSWHVRAIGSAGTSAYSSPFTFSTTTTTSISTTVVTFPASPAASTDYRLVSIPGTTVFTVGTLLTGSQNTDWRIFRDNGGTPPNHLTELSAASQLSVGEGYWVVRTGAFTFTQSVAMPQLAADGTAGITLHDGWNIIGNPFNSPVAWSAVLAANGLASGSIYQYQGQTGSQTASTVDPFRGYYFNNSTSLQSLKIPFPFPGSGLVGPPPQPVEWSLRLVYESPTNRDAENHVGISPVASNERDILDEQKPPPFLDQGYLYFSRPDWDQRYPLFGADFRPTLGDGQIWDFEVHHPKLEHTTLSIVGAEQVPPLYQICLIDRLNSVPRDIRSSGTYDYTPVSKDMSFRLIIGTPEFVHGELQKIVPAEFRLAQNFPNPFNPSTSITFTIPRESQVLLEIYSVLGEKVATLENGRLAPGVYTRPWNPGGADRAVASGVYLYRLTVDGKPLQTRKMIFLQ